MTNNYINEKRKKNALKEERDNFFFGFCFSIILFSIFLVKFLANVSITFNDHFSLTMMGISVVILILDIVYPNMLKYLKFILSFLAKTIIKLIFSIILTIIYFLFICTFGIFIKSKQKISNEVSTFSDYKYSNSVINIGKKSFIYQVAKIFRFFYNEKNVILIPVLIVLILVAAILVFVQSSVIAPFIYTIF